MGFSIIQWLSFIQELCPSLALGLHRLLHLPQQLTLLFSSLLSTSLFSRLRAAWSVTLSSQRTITSVFPPGSNRSHLQTQQQQQQHMPVAWLGLRCTFNLSD